MRTKIDPVGDQGSDGDDAAFDTDEQATVGSLRALGLVRRDRGSVHAITDTCDDTAEDKLQQRNVIDERGHLDDDTDDHDGSAGEDHIPTAHPVCCEQREHGADQTADLVHRSDRRLHDAVAFGGREHIVEVLVGDDARHNALVIAEEQEAHGRNGRDCHAEFSAGQATECGCHIRGKETGECEVRNAVRRAVQVLDIPQGIVNVANQTKHAASPDIYKSAAARKYMSIHTTEIVNKDSNHVPPTGPRQPSTEPLFVLGQEHR